MLLKEKNISTNIRNIAIPHGNPDFVKQTKLVISKLSKPIKWKDSYVKYIFLFAISKEVLSEHQSVFSTFYRKLATPELEEYLFNLEDALGDNFKKTLVSLVKR